MKGRAITYSQEELTWIEAHKSMTRRKAHAAFCEKFGRTDVSLKNYHALCKRKRWLTGRSGRFDPGHETWNKGKNMPYNAKSAATRFQKGNKPHTYRGVGHEMLCPKDGYVYLIVAETNPHAGADTRRVLKHKWLWERENGTLPKGHCLKCLDGDKTNTDPANWEAIPRALLPRLNGRFGRGYDDAPAELKPTILATAKLEHAARTARKELDQ